jgi:hypothetical protein
MLADNKRQLIHQVTHVATTYSIYILPIQSVNTYGIVVCEGDYLAEQPSVLAATSVTDADRGKTYQEAVTRVMSDLNYQLVQTTGTDETPISWNDFFEQAMMNLRIQFLLDGTVVISG